MSYFYFPTPKIITTDIAVSIAHDNKSYNYYVSMSFYPVHDKAFRQVVTLASNIPINRLELDLLD